MKRLVTFLLLLLTFSSYAQCCIAESNVNSVESIVSFQFILEKIMPWIVALIIGCLTIFITRNQIKASKESINKQIDASMKIAQLEINKSVLSGNRQDWINTLRDTSSELVANLESLNIELINAKLIKQTREFKLNQKYTFEISRLGTKIELLLNPIEEKTKIALDALKNMSSSIITDEAITSDYNRIGYKVHEKVFLDTIKKILKEEWQRVKNGV